MENQLKKFAALFKKTEELRTKAAATISAHQGEDYFRKIVIYYSSFISKHSFLFQFFFAALTPMQSTLKAIVDPFLPREWYDDDFDTVVMDDDFDTVVMDVDGLAPTPPATQEVDTLAE